MIQDKMLRACPKRAEVKWIREKDNVVITYKKSFTRFERWLNKFFKGPRIYV